MEGIFKFIHSQGSWWRLLETEEDLLFYILATTPSYLTTTVVEAQNFANRRPQNAQQEALGGLIYLESLYSNVLHGEEIGEKLSYWMSALQLYDKLENLWRETIKAGDFVLINKVGGWHRLKKEEKRYKLVLYKYGLGYIEVYPKDLTISLENLGDEKFLVLYIDNQLVTTKYGIYFRNYSNVYELSYCFANVGVRNDELSKMEILDYYGLY